ncbi:MAG: four helix bundle protein [Candidatus Hydrogenedentes bacterium]|nr:four helix bundle protein [Candidatus Hydrogenedentota bacterium]
MAVVQLAQRVRSDLPEPLSANLLGTGTLIGAEVARAYLGTSRRHLLTHMTAARHACQEIQYWLRLILAADIASEEAVNPLLDEAHRLYNTIATICAKARQNLESDAAR